MLELRPHQQDVVTKIEDGFADGHRCQLLYAPTGFGKTEVAMAIMKEVSAKYKKTAMVLDRIVLVNQTSRGWRAMASIMASCKQTIGALGRWNASKCAPPRP